MTNNAFGQSRIANLPSGDARAQRRVADVIRQCTSLDGRQGFRVAGKSASGHIFFEAGHVVHAEFGEDCGLRAVVEMLRSGPMAIDAAASWPSQPSLHLGPELLLSMMERDASRVMRKVDLPVTPPPLPQYDVFGSELVPPVHPEASRSFAAPRRAISGVVPRAVEPEPILDSASESGQASSRAPSPLRVMRADRGKGAAARSLAVRRASKQQGAPEAIPQPPQAHAVTAAAADAAVRSPTTMVRITTRGELLAARGKNAEQLAEAAAFIHGLATLIATDFGRHGRANVHLSGQGQSLLVARSEVNDIAAALGQTERLASLLNKVGLK
jgi:hypothetical protein